MSEENLRKATYGEWQLSLFGACFVAGGIGYYLAQYLSVGVASAITVLGILMHGIGIYKIHQRNN